MKTNQNNWWRKIAKDTQNEAYKWKRLSSKTKQKIQDFRDQSNVTINTNITRTNTLMMTETKIIITMKENFMTIEQNIVIAEAGIQETIPQQK